VLTGESISFNASASYDSDGSIVSYFWDFGDGTNSTGVTIEHAYTEIGTYTITLVATDNDGASDTATATKNVGNSPPVASFTESETTVYTGTAISFDASDSYDADGIIVSYFWDFGDGTNSTGISVGHSYSDDGIFIVTLTVTDDDGALGSISAIKTVLNQAPVAIFEQSKTTAYTGEQISFDASDSYDADGIIVSYWWDFGDGTNSTGITVSHVYTNDGDYITTLTLTDDDNTTSLATGTTRILNRAPVASFTESADTEYTDEYFTFNASSSFDLDGSIVSFFWDFGDGSNSSGVVVSHSYVGDGVYTVTLTVTDDDGASDSVQSTKTVLNRAPVALFTESATIVYTSEIVTFNASSSYDSDGVIVSFFWDFGDGSNSSGVAVSHSYADNGSYTVILTVTDDDGVVDSVSAAKSVLNRVPVASFSESATTVYTNDVITFNASSSFDPDGSIVSYLWDFGDGANSTEVNTTHAYPDDGLFTVTLTVIDNDGESTSSTATKTILNRSPTAVFTESASTVYNGQPIHLNASDSFDPDGVIVSYFWDFGDGTNGTNVITEHTYLINGTYTLTLTVTDEDGSTDSASAVKTVLWNEPPIAIFTESAETVDTDELISFNASSSYDPDGSITSFFWDFGDGTNATGATISHSYVDDGNYPVTLKVTDDKGAVGTVTADKTILNRSPVAMFTESATIVNTGETIMFNASSSYDPDGSITSFFWDFGDGSNASGVFVSHSYIDNGNYTVILTVIDDDNATSQVGSMKTVRNQHPTSLFTFSPNLPIVGETVLLNASSSYDSDGSIVSYLWDFGDGNTTLSATPITSHVYVLDGNYTVTLTVTDNDGSTGSTVKIIRIRDYPAAYFTYSPVNPGEGVPVIFNASLSQPNGGHIISYAWNFGDGNVTTTTEAIVSHVFALSGNYSVTLNITDSEDLHDFIIQTLEVGVAPIASFNYLPSLPSPGDTVTFNASTSYDPDGSISNYTWSFGDGNITTTSNPIILHRYTVGSDYIVLLTVTDNNGITDRALSVLTVEDNPTAQYQWTPDFPIVGETVTFDASRSTPNGGTIINYTWNFGDGVELNTIDPVITHSYDSHGIYTVQVIVMDNYGLTGAISKTVSVRDYPTADFTFSPSPAQRGIPTLFNATISEPNGGTIIEYQWDFGDGNITSTSDPLITYIFVSEGLRHVKLTVTDDENLTSSQISKTVIISNACPFALFTINPSPPVSGEPTTFNASLSYDVDGTVTGYFWDFGDGGNATGEIVEHTYNSTGTYEVILTVEDNDGCRNSDSQMVEVFARPSADFAYSPFPIAIVLEPVTFNASTSSPGSGSIINYTWNFDDGNVTTTTEPVITHIFSEVGAYRVTLTIINTIELTDLVAAWVNVYGIPYANFTWTPSISFANETVTFNASNSEPNGGYIQRYFWDFGDGTPIVITTYPITTHEFTTTGTYNVTLRVRNNAGLEDVIFAELSVISWPKAEFQWSPDPPYTFDLITFNASSSSPGTGIITSYVWNFGDGNITTTANPLIIHTYLFEGIYTVTLNITNSAGQSHNASRNLTINAAQPPIVEFIFSPSSPGVDGSILFNASESIARGGLIIEYEWSFGDGNVTQTPTPIIYHTYSVEGNYTVTLNLTNTAGYSNTKSAQLVVVPISDPTAAFTWSPSVPYINRTITFDASSSISGWNGTTYPPIVNYTWNFGDGNITTTMNSYTTHLYTSKGNYTVTLTVTDSDGRTANLTNIITVTGLIGDLNGDGKVDMRDVAIVARAFGTEPGDPYWNPVADLTGPDGEPDGKIDMRDVAVPARHFGDHI
jgi:PKD repeat protein